MEAELLRLVRELADEVSPVRLRRSSASLDVSLERELGLGSLGRAELLERVGRRFGVRLPEDLLATAETPRDLLRALAEQAPPDLAAEARQAAEAPSPDLGPVEPAPERLRTLHEVLAWHACRHPGRRHITFLSGDGTREELTYGALAERARAVAAGLTRLGLPRGQAVGIMLPSGLDYFAAFLGVLLAGGVPTPLYPPARPHQAEAHLLRQAALLETAEAEILITLPAVVPFASLLRGKRRRRLVTVAELETGPPSGPLPEAAEGDTALLQLTSGSTGQPKGVVLTHANLLANIHAIGRSVSLTPADTVVSWLPLYHDMGLIGAWMASLTYGMPLVLMSPLTFLARPASWLEAISRERGTLSAAPNFAYELCASRLEDADLAGLDLSSWRWALNGAEPVVPETLQRFCERFAPCGFRPEAMAPVYGLAECSLALAFPPLGRPPVIDGVDRETFQRTGRAVPAPGDPRALRFVSCGRPLPGHEIRVVDAAGHEAGEREEGTIQFRGPSATAGYFRNPEATARLVRGAWLDAGDRGYLAGGEVYVTGRAKDIVIRGGRNLHPYELERAVGAVPGVRKGCVVAFGVPDPAAGTERLVVVAESRERGAAARERLLAAVRAAIVDLLGEPADDVVLAPPHAVPKTSSGKLRRASARDAYVAGTIDRPRGTAGPLLRLAAAALAARLAALGRTVPRRLYNLRVRLAVLLVVPPAWLALAALPGLARRRRLARAAARTVLRLAGIPLRVEAEEAIGEGPRIFVANHASYLDGTVLTAALPPNVVFAVERELEGNLFTRVLMRRLGAVLLERFDRAVNAGEVDRLTAAAAGNRLVVFPEGLFRNAPGLRPFRMGAFLAAARCGVPVVPVVLCGTRAVLHDFALYFRRGSVEVTVLPEIAPAGSGWPEAVALRDAARAAILARCGEPDLPPDQADL